MPEYFNVTFEGTASRSDYWKNQLAVLGSIMTVGVLLVAAIFAKCAPLGVLLAFVLLVVGCYCSVSAYAVGARRCRDLGHSGWMVLLYMVPLVSLPFMFYLGFARGKL